MKARQFAACAAIVAGIGITPSIAEISDGTVKLGVLTDCLLYTSDAADE